MSAAYTPDAIDSQFRRAVAAIDAGDEPALRRLLAEYPDLANARLEHPGPWLTGQLGGAVPEFFDKPYLVWFVAEDPVRNGTLPKNIADVTRAIIGAAVSAGSVSLQTQLDRGLQLVAWSWIARDAGVQIGLIDAFVDAGASPEGRPNDALVNGNFDAAAHLIARGAPLTLAAAACLARWDDAARLGAGANDGQKQFAFVLAAMHGNAEALRRLLALGADINRPSEDLYSHGSPLHHAVSSGSLDAVRTLVEAGAELRAVDAAWGGTPLGWAEYYLQGEPARAAHHREYDLIAAYLRTGMVPDETH